MYPRVLESVRTPYYLFDEVLFINNIKRFYAAFRAIYPEYIIAYSYKTNYTPYICRMAKEFGCYAEVVSDMEYTLARKLGYENKKIIYNGPHKGPLLEEHLSGGGIVNVDNYEECVRICRFAKSNPETEIRIGLRISLDLGNGFVTRFGMESGGKDLQKCLTAFETCNNVHVVGIHGHIRAPRDPESWRRRSELLISAADKYIEGVPEYISMGSGMVPGRYDQVAEELDDFFPDYADFAKDLFAPFINRYSGGRRPVVITEPGRALITRYVRFFAKVESIKTIQDKIIATTDGSFHNIGEICTLARVPVIVHHNPLEGKGALYDGIDIMGYTCLEQDLMFPAYTGRIAVGDILEFRNVGGYSIVYKPQFICPQCAMYALREDGSLKMIMREESFEDVYAKFLCL